MFRSKSLVIVCLIGIPLQIFSQFHFIILDEKNKDCEITGATYSGIENWDVFQTENDLQDGQRIPNCAEYSGRILDVSDFQAMKPLFLKTNTDLNLEISSNLIHRLSFLWSASQGVFCNCNESCGDTFCSTISLVFEGEFEGQIVADTVLLDSPVSIPPGSVSSTLSHTFESCLTTPKFENILLNEIIISFIPIEIFDDSQLQLSTIRLFEEELFVSDNTFVNNGIPEEFRAGISYIVEPNFFLDENVFPFGPVKVKVLHEGNGLPSKDNIFYNDINVEDSSSEKIINIINTASSQLVFQNYTQLRGAVVDVPGNNSIRHRLNLVNDGADLCLPGFFEIIFGGEDEFRFRSGDLFFGNKSSCLQFNNKSRFVIESKSHMNYGQNGTGLLALKDASSITLEEDASLFFDGELILSAFEPLPYVELEFGNRLSFSKKSKIHSFENETPLTVYMNGGVLDISDLDQKYHKYLNIVYPNNSRSENSNFLVFPNPVIGTLNIQALVECESCLLSFYDINGQMIKEDIQLKSGNNQFDISSFDAGLYFLKTSEGEIIKIVKE